MARTLITFGNATLRRDCIMGVVTIPGAYPGNPPRTRLITPGSFPVDVPESHEEAVRRWRGSDGEESIRVRAQETELAAAQSKLLSVKNVLANATGLNTVEDLQRLVSSALAIVVAEKS